MSFNVTQCPACESTFNTNSRVLNAAAGKVRCGACLNVFEAIDHFLLPDADDETALEHGESVFVGNNPQEFFDPSRFLTRSALTESSNSDAAAMGSLDERDLHDKLERAGAVSEDFFATVAGELHGNPDGEALSASENEPGTKSDEATLEQPYATTEQFGSAIIDERLEEEIIDSFDALAQTVPEQPSPEETEQYRDTEAAFSELAEPAEQHLETDLEQQYRIDEDPTEKEGEVAQETTEDFTAAQPQRVSEQPFIGIELTASFSYDPRLDAKKIDPEDEAPPDSELRREQEAQSEAVDSDTRRFRENEQQFLNAVSEELEQSSAHANGAYQSEAQVTPAAYFSAADAVEETETRGIETQQAEARSDDTPEPLPVEELPAESAATNPEVTNDDSTASIDLASAVAASSEADEQREDIAALEEASTNAELDEDLAEDDDRAEEIAVVAVVEEEASTETGPASKTEIDEDSTEAIRARALETELSDERALEAIPQENLAVLGAMSTPVELLSRKESRLLRNALLSLSIVILSGLLSGQYLWRYRELYSQLPQLRPIYEQACHMLDCDLPEYTDIDSIRSENLTVQTHPTFTNGLMVNTAIRNTAAFDQPFPLLILSFNSAANSVIALREFAPSEYLDPGLRSIQSMPSMTPVQVGLAIMDPGPEAVNYTLAFRWP